MTEENKEVVEETTEQPIEEVVENKRNDTLLLGFFGIVVGALVAASVMFRRVGVDWSEGVKPPFTEQE